MQLYLHFYIFADALYKFWRNVKSKQFLLCKSRATQQNNFVSSISLLHLCIVLILVAMDQSYVSTQNNVPKYITLSLICNWILNHVSFFCLLFFVINDLLCCKDRQRWWRRGQTWFSWKRDHAPHTQLDIQAQVLEKSNSCNWTNCQATAFRSQSQWQVFSFTDASADDAHEKNIGQRQCNIGERQRWQGRASFQGPIEADWEDDVFNRHLDVVCYDAKG